MLLITAVVATASACGGASAPVTDDAAANGAFAGASLPPEATKKVKINRANCFKGDALACDWVGVWFQVGGAGEAQRGHARAYFKRSCDKGHQPGCAHLRNLQADE